MAELNNGRDGELYLGVVFDLHRKESQHGVIARNHVVMNSDLGLVWAEISFWVGQKAIYTQEVLMHSNDIRRFTSQVIQIIEAPARIYGLPNEHRTENGVERELSLSITSPELIWRIRQNVYLPESMHKKFDFPASDANEMTIKQALAEAFNQPPDSDFVREQYTALTEISTSYECLVVIEAGIARGSQTVRGEGPAMFLEPDQERLLRFMHDLRSEAEMVLLLG
jgi:hypothetical protein